VWVTIIFALLHGFTIWFLLKRAGLIFSLFYFSLALLKLFTIFAVLVPSHNIGPENIKRPFYWISEVRRRMKIERPFYFYGI
jgi:hypothetical protein